MNSIFVIAPPVGGGERLRLGDYARATAFAAGVVGGAVSVGSILGWAGRQLSTAYGSEVILVFVALSMAVLVSEMARPRASIAVFSGHWVVPRSWRVGLPAPLYEVIFGVILGTGFLTVIPYGGLYILFIGIASTADPSTAAGTMVAFAVFRTLPLVLIAATPVMRGGGPLEFPRQVRDAMRASDLAGHSVMKLFRFVSSAWVVGAIYGRLW